MLGVNFYDKANFYIHRITQHIAKNYYVNMPLAGLVEISTERGANIIFHAIYFFKINVFMELMYWKE